MQASIKYIRKELAETYPKEEVEGFIRIILQHLKGYNLTDLVTKQDEALTSEEIEKIHTIVDRLKQSEPIQYILGEADFYDLTFKVNRKVLIPRPETEELVRWILRRQKDGMFRVLDIGTGSGCIPISLKRHYPKANVLACDISADALHVAKENAARHQAEIAFFHLDILDPQLPETFEKIDVLVSNPPYVTESEKQQMQNNVLQYEPETALFVPDGQALMFYKAIAVFAKKHLATNGKLFLEINEAFGRKTKSLLKENGFSNVQLKKDINGKDRMIFAKLCEH
ncbi:peptide chain release factor N(5)-glutamine methyltransferase [Sunxiuqinia indica]|uniref:peptide chain release factor N(5)-glutamine methyltransferase n=1 Tax=Sunxiuqinia indica TaxID=2692584 RepID=UPI0013592628|nr:peptide chain release factor N(5)-glutamine methyltransferase [Sunxiuqinia indica]